MCPSIVIMVICGLPHGRFSKVNDEQTELVEIVFFGEDNQSDYAYIQCVYIHWEHTVTHR